MKVGVTGVVTPPKGLPGVRVPRRHVKKTLEGPGLYRRLTMAGSSKVSEH